MNAPAGEVRGKKTVDLDPTDARRPDGVMTVFLQREILVIGPFLRFF